MAIVCNLTNGWLISHAYFIKIVYSNTHHKQSSKIKDMCFCDELFKIYTPFKVEHNLQVGLGLNTHTNKLKRSRRKRMQFVGLSDNIIKSDRLTFGSKIEEVNFVKNLYDIHIAEGKKNGHFPSHLISLERDSNEEARDKSNFFYHESSKHASKLDFHGSNNTDSPILSHYENELYIFPQRCDFFCYDVHEIKNKIHLLKHPYDLILLDPPWWNKCIRRKKKVNNSEATYKMMYNEDIAQLPIASLLAPGSLVAVWCTNSESNLNALKNVLFPSWGVKFIGQWYWLKITQNGQPVCPFTAPPGKQPFEKLVFGYYCDKNRSRPLPEDGKMILSVPSAIHSHKPPLAEILSAYLPPEPRCLELFARYLLPGWTSWGNEVLKLQHISLYKAVEIDQKSTVPE